MKLADEINAKQLILEKWRMKCRIKCINNISLKIVMHVIECNDSMHLIVSILIELSAFLSIQLKDERKPKMLNNFGYYIFTYFCINILGHYLAINTSEVSTLGG